MRPIVTKYSIPTSITSDRTVATASVPKVTDQAVNLHELGKLIQICQRNLAKLDTVAIKELAYEIFHKHKQPSDQTIKDRLKEKLENDEYYASRLQKMHEKDVSFDLLWEDKLYSLMLAANCSKRDYYIRKIKESLWSTFGINRLKPFEDTWNKLKMKEWKQSKTTRQAHHDLYSQSDPEDDNSNTYITLIIKSVFTAGKEHTDANAMWTQAVLESIFNENHLSTKIDSEVVKIWTDTITDSDLVNTQLNLYNMFEFQIN
ncbi:hypothetical protein C1645_837221 [Glomus cerebriforme]|uniref:Uncharacterized protein n=1 Tax=Glomus cerebriforme TaxID=658196 RepID=A0A397S4G0_9GLOM|nr:hypothetical protein C1645_837221 [Glomus cerebriforme]